MARVKRGKRGVTEVDCEGMFDHMDELERQEIAKMVPGVRYSGPYGGPYTALDPLPAVAELPRKPVGKTRDNVPVSLRKQAVSIVRKAPVVTKIA